MIPIALLVGVSAGGLLRGRWWFLAAPLAAAVWTLLMVMNTPVTGSSAAHLPSAALVGFLNGLVGAIVGYLIRRVFDRQRTASNLPRDEGQRAR